MARLPPVRIRIITEKRTFQVDLPKEESVLGRSAECDIPIDAVGVSRKHLKIKYIEGELNLVDLGSTNGSYYQGTRMPQGVPVLYTGGRIALGPASDGNFVEFEVQAKEKTRTQTQAQNQAAPTLEPSIVIDRKEQSQVSRSIASEVRRPEEPREPSRVRARTVSEEELQAIEMDIAAAREQLRKLRNEQEDAEIARRDAEKRRHEVEEDLLRVRKELEAGETRLGTIREKIREEASRLEREEVKIRDWRREVEAEKEELLTYQRKLSEERDQLDRERQDLNESHQLQVHKLNDELEGEKIHFSEEHQKLLSQHRSQKRRLEDEMASAKEQHEREMLEVREKCDREMLQVQTKHDREIRKLEQECEQAVLDLRKRSERELSELQASVDEQIQALKTKESEAQALFESQEKKFKVRLETLSAEIDLRATQEQKEIEKRKTERVVVEREIEGFRAQTELAKKELQQFRSSLAGLQKQTEEVESGLEKKRGELSQLELKFKRSEEDLSKVVDAIQQKKSLLSKLETELSEQQKKNRTDRDTFIREFEKEKSQSRQQMLAEKEAHHQNLESEKKRIWSEAQAERDRILQEAQSERDRTTQEAQAERDRMLQDAQAQREHMLQTTQFETERLVRESRQLLEQELAGKRERAELQLKQDTEKWVHDLDQRRRHEGEELALWLADERKKVQAKLTGDLDNFVESVTSSALAQLQQNGQLGTMLHQIHSKLTEDLKTALTTDGTFVAQFNPNRKRESRVFWIRSVTALFAIVLGGALVKVAPQFLETVIAEKRADKSGGSAGEWLRKMAAERAERLALKIQARSEFQEAFVDNVLYNEGYLEMKLDTELQTAWIKELNSKMTGERAMGLSEEAVVEYIRIEHSLFLDLQQKKEIMNALNKDELMVQMAELEKKARQDFLDVFKNKVLPSSDRARLTTAEQKFDQIRELEKSFYVSVVSGALANERVPASSETGSKTR